MDSSSAVSKGAPARQPVPESSACVEIKFQAPPSAGCVEFSLVDFHAAFTRSNKLRATAATLPSNPVQSTGGWAVCTTNSLPSAPGGAAPSNGVRSDPSGRNGVSCFFHAATTL